MRVMMRGVSTLRTSLTTVWVDWELKLLSTWDWYWAVRADLTAVSI